MPAVSQEYSSDTRGIPSNVWRCIRALTLSPTCCPPHRAPPRRKCARSSTRRPSRMRSLMTPMAGARECGTLSRLQTNTTGTLAMDAFLLQWWLPASMLLQRWPSLLAHMQMEPDSTAAVSRHLHHPKPPAALHAGGTGALAAALHLCICLGLQLCGFFIGQHRWLRPDPGTMHAIQMQNCRRCCLPACSPSITPMLHLWRSR